MEWTDLLVALSLVLVIEGLLPFVAPQRFKDAMLQMNNLSNSALRNVGGLTMLAGVVMLYVVR